MSTRIRRPGATLRFLLGAIPLALGLVSPAFGQTPLTCAEVGGTCRTLEEGPAAGEILDNSGSCSFEGGPMKKCYAPAVCEERGGACWSGVASCSNGSTQLGNGQCSSGPCCTLPTAGPTCQVLVGHANFICSPYSDSCPDGYVNRGPTKDPCMSCCDLAANPPPPPPPPPPGGGEYKVEYLHTDALGSVRMVTDQEGAVVSRRDYYPFGGEIDASTNGRAVFEGYTLDPSVRQRFTGKERDGESGLDYFGARYYSGAQGRFTVPDLPFADQEVQDPQSWNLYSYTRNNPLKYVDEDGRGLLGVAVKLARAGYKGHDLYSSVSGAVEATQTIFSGDASIGTAARLTATVALLGEVSGVSDVLPSSGTRRAVGEVAGHIDDVGDAAKSGDNVVEATARYKRPSGATTPDQRALVQGQPCVDCGAVAPKMYADHKTPLVKEHYETGSIDKKKMRDPSAVQSQCPTCSNRQGADLSRYSREQRKKLEEQGLLAK